MDDIDEKAIGDHLYSLDFQRGLLKILCTNMAFFSNYGELIKEEYFETHSLKVLCKLIKDYVVLYEKELDLSSLIVVISNYALSFSLAEETTKVVDADAKAIMNTHIKSEQFYTDNLLKFARQQELKSALFKSVEIMEKDGSYEQVLAMIDKAVGVGAGTNDQELTFADLLTLPVQYMKKFSPASLITTGFPTWDKALEGGFAPGELHVVQAPPKTGKSSLAIQTGAANLRRGKNVFHISLEISKHDVGMKYCMNMSGMTKEQIGKISEAEYQFKIKKYDQFKPQLFINAWTEGTVNTMAIRSWISRVRVRTGITPDIIILDYDDCLLPTTGKAKKAGGENDMYGDAGQIYSDMLGLAAYFHCPILTFAQPQREAWENANDGKLITFDKLAHSAKKAHKCTSVSSLNFTDESTSGILYVDIVRRGESKVKVKIKKDLSRCWIFES